MKVCNLPILFCILCGCLNAADTNSANQEKTATNLTNVSISAPSDLRGGGNKGTTPYTLDFVLRPLRDFRLLYCDVQTLERRVSSGVCVVDFAISGSHLEVKVTANTTLDDVLRLGNTHLYGWRPGIPPHVVIVGKRAILGDDEGTDFLKTSISPGDFVVVQAIHY